MHENDTLFGAVKNGVLTIGAGYPSSIKIDRNQLIVRDGDAERKFSRAHCPVSRIYIVRSEGYLTIPAVRWMHELGIAVTALKFDGTPILMSIPRANAPSTLRRTQALITLSTPAGNSIAVELLRAKIEGQAANLQWLNQHSAADEVFAYIGRLRSSVRRGAVELLGIEGMASVVYWRALSETPQLFGKRQSVPDHWRALGTRHSTITGTPRGAVTPGNALLNYLYSVLASEITIALHAAGLDPALGILHADKDDRASLAYDLMEPARPILDRWFLRWVGEITFSKRDFNEDIHGQIRVMYPLNAHLAMTAALWRAIADNLAQWIYARLNGEKADLKLPDAHLYARDAARRALRWNIGRAFQRPIPSTCAECGKALPKRRRKFCSAACATDWHSGKPYTAGLTAIAKARAERVAAGDRTAAPVHRIAAQSIKEWHRMPGWSKSLDSEMRAWFSAEISPRLKDLRPAEIARALNCSKWYSVELHHGRRLPHPRLHRTLANLARIDYPFPSL
jgi:CRISPR-associated endonuclease Cas1